MSYLTVRNILLKFIVLSLLVILPVACNDHDVEEIKVSSSAQQVLQKVDPKKVCMVNNTYMYRDQIPIEVAGKTYFGCCSMCKNKLMNNATTRYALDPINGKKVDKAGAKTVIGMLPKGKVLYFYSQKTFDVYVKKMS